MTSIVVVEDHGLVRDALVRFLNGEPLFQVVASSRTVAEARAAIADTTPDLALIDIQLPDGDGLDLAATIPTLRPTTKVIMLTTFGRPTRLPTPRTRRRSPRIPPQRQPTRRPRRCHHHRPGRRPRHRPRTRPRRPRLRHQPTQRPRSRRPTSHRTRPQHPSDRPTTAHHRRNRPKPPLQRNRQNRTNQPQHRRPPCPRTRLAPHRTPQLNQPTPAEAGLRPGRLRERACV